MPEASFCPDALASAGGTSRATAALRWAMIGALVVVAAAACAPATPPESPAPGQIEATIPENGVDNGLLVFSATTDIVRPERRDFEERHLEQLRMPEGFRIEVFTEGLENPRVIRGAEDGSVFVAEREVGQVRLLRDESGDGRPDVSRIVAERLGQGLSGVHGLAIHEGHLYMVTETELHRAPIEQDGDLGEPELLREGLPEGGQHPNRTIEFGPDGMLYLSIGSTCNACKEPNELHATIVRMTPEGEELDIFAHGLRNTIAFGWHPVSGRLFGVDNNSDGRGELFPPEELNEIRQGLHYGWPWCFGDGEVDPLVAAEPDDAGRHEFCATTEAPVVPYTAHAAPMQIHYYTGDQFPEEFRHDAFVTMRGSWNRNPPVGYEIVRIRFDDAGQPLEIEPFVGSWLLDEGRAHFGRLMGITGLPDGSLLVGDDENGVIYRIRYEG